MIELLIGTGWTFAAGFIGYHIGYGIESARHRATVRKMKRDAYYLRKWLDRQRQATVEADLAYELERIRNV